MIKSNFIRAICLILALFGHASTSTAQEAFLEPAQAGIESAQDFEDINAYFKKIQTVKFKAWMLQGPVTFSADNSELAISYRNKKGQSWSLFNLKSGRKTRKVITHTDDRFNGVAGARQRVFLGPDKTWLWFESHSPKAIDADKYYEFNGWPRICWRMLPAGFKPIKNRPIIIDDTSQMKEVCYKSPDKDFFPILQDVDVSDDGAFILLNTIVSWHTKNIKLRKINIDYLPSQRGGVLILDSRTGEILRTFDARIDNQNLTTINDAAFIGDNKVMMIGYNPLLTKRITHMKVNKLRNYSIDPLKKPYMRSDKDIYIWDINLNSFEKLPFYKYRKDYAGRKLALTGSHSNDFVVLSHLTPSAKYPAPKEAPTHFDNFIVYDINKKSVVSRVASSRKEITIDKVQVRPWESFLTGSYYLASRAIRGQGYVHELYNFEQNRLVAKGKLPKGYIILGTSEDGRYIALMENKGYRRKVHIYKFIEH